MQHKWTVDRRQRIDVFLSLQAKIGSRAKAQKLLKAGYIALNGVPLKKASYVLSEGDNVAIIGALEEAHGAMHPADLPLSVLYEDDACMVVAKPAGVSMHPGAGMRKGTVTVLHGVAKLFEDRNIPFHPSSVLVHRLDKETTGCLLVAKSPDAHRKLQKQFQERAVQKQYLALVAGVPRLPRAMIDAPIGRSTSERTKMSVFSAGKLRSARTTYAILHVGKDSVCSLLLCYLLTGRTHQVRVHLASIGHPILGDTAYGTERSKAIEIAGVDTLCLHAWKLQFTAPSGQTVAVIAPLSSKFSDVLARLNFPKVKDAFPNA